MKRVKINRLIHQTRKCEPLFQYQRFEELGITPDDVEKFKKSKISKCGTRKGKKRGQKRLLIESLYELGFYKEANDVIHNRDILAVIGNKTVLIIWMGMEIAVAKMYEYSRNMPFIEAVKTVGSFIKANKVNEDLTELL